MIRAAATKNSFSFFSKKFIFVAKTISTMLIMQARFHLKFGKAKEALALWKQIAEEFAKSGTGEHHYRMISDLSGRAYTLTWEIHIKNFNEINPMNYYWAINPRVGELYREVVQYCSSGSQEIYRIEMEV